MMRKIVGAILCAVCPYLISFVVMCAVRYLIDPAETLREVNNPDVERESFWNPVSVIAIQALIYSIAFWPVFLALLWSAQLLNRRGRVSTQVVAFGVSLLIGVTLMRWNIPFSAFLWGGHDGEGAMALGRVLYIFGIITDSLALLVTCIVGGQMFAGLKNRRVRLEAPSVVVSQN
ncbi:MAG: hypothetical protein ABIY70_25870 [Capsulimonas sp.]|uniref:hypothetical protein n=1 Tax=Capsulimonas sp. TaxID=2494211 RepID=UPI0032672C87